jgi:alkylation response protein AidB-like acyl-CoA dehydrogenase
MQAISRPIAEVTPSPSIADTLIQLNAAIATELAPIVSDIDLKGTYPRDFMHHIGAIGAFAQAVSPEFGGAGHGLRGAVQMIEAVSQECLCTGFMTWCQVACTWYMQNSDNPYLQQQVLPQVATGKRLGGTGLSNPMKHFAGIEKIALMAERTSGGYILNGLLPWVSNIGVGHYFGIAAQLADCDDYLMAIVSDELEGLTLRQNAHFVALEGSNTYSCVFRDVFVPDDLILAAPCTNYVNQIRPGFILTQVGMGLGLTASCLEIMERSNQRYGHVNCFLDDRTDNLSEELESLRQKTYALADEITNRTSIDRTQFKEVIQARITASELSLKAANAAMLHTGARGYLHGSKAERKLRESYFVAIVTPALKQLKKMLSNL